MSPVRWETLIADERGVIDYKRVRSLASIGLAIAGAVPLLLAMLGVGNPGDSLPLGAGVLVAPLTAGRIGDVLAGRKAASPGPDP